MYQVILQGAEIKDVRFSIADMLSMKYLLGELQGIV